MSEEPRRPVAHVVAWVLIVLGALLSGALLVRTFSLLVFESEGAIDVCGVFGGDCDATLRSPSSWFLDIPIAGWGVVYFSLLAVLLALRGALGAAFATSAWVALLAVASVGFGVSLFLGTRILTGGVPTCPLCLLVQAVNVALLPTLVVASARPWASHARALAMLVGYFRGRDVAPASSVRVTWLAWAFASVCALVVYQAVLVQTDRRVAAGEAFDPDRVREEFAAEAPLPVRVDPDDARMGPRDAPVTLVVFSSFRCPGCQVLSLELRRLAALFPERLAIVFKHFPATGRCDAETQPVERSCAAAWAAEAAKLQGRFWEFHDALFAQGLDASEAMLREAAARAGLVAAEFDAARRSAPVLAKVRDDLDLAAQLDIHHTPAVYINRRPVREVSSRILETLILSELDTWTPENLP